MVQGNEVNGNLQCTADKHGKTYCIGNGPGVLFHEKPQCSDHRDVKQGRGHGGRCKMLFVLQQCGQEGHNEDKVEVPEVDGGQRCGLSYLLPVPAPGKHFGNGFGKKGDHKREADQKKKESQKNGGGKDSLVLRCDKGGHEGLCECTFGKDTPEKIGQFEGYEEHVGPDRGTQSRGHEYVTSQAGNTRKEYAEAVGKDGT